jgi:hypothetical protein
MRQIPQELLYGIDVAVKKLRPNATFELYNTEITKYHCPMGTSAPTWLEIQEQLHRDKEAFEAWVNSLPPDDDTQVPPPGPASTEVF